MAGLKKMENATRTLIYLDQAVLDAIKRRALTAGVSMADLVRQAINEYLKRHPATEKGGAAMRGDGQHIFRGETCCGLPTRFGGKTFKGVGASTEETDAKSYPQTAKQRLKQVERPWFRRTQGGEVDTCRYERDARSRL